MVLWEEKEEEISKGQDFFTLPKVRDSGLVDPRRNVLRCWYSERFCFIFQRRSFMFALFVRFPGEFDIYCGPIRMGKNISEVLPYCTRNKGRRWWYVDILNVLLYAWSWIISQRHDWRVIVFILNLRFILKPGVLYCYTARSGQGIPSVANQISSCGAHFSAPITFLDYGCRFCRRNSCLNREWSTNCEGKSRFSRTSGTETSCACEVTDTTQRQLGKLHRAVQSDYANLLQIL